MVLHTLEPRYCKRRVTPYVTARPTGRWLCTSVRRLEDLLDVGCQKIPNLKDSLALGASLLRFKGEQTSGRPLGETATNLYSLPEANAGNLLFLLVAQSLVGSHETLLHIITFRASRRRISTNPLPPCSATTHPGHAGIAMAIAAVSQLDE